VLKFAFASNISRSFIPIVVTN